MSATCVFCIVCCSYYICVLFLLFCYRCYFAVVLLESTGFCLCLSIRHVISTAHQLSISSTLVKPNWYLWVILIQLVMIVIFCKLMPLLQRLTVSAKSLVERLQVALQYLLIEEGHTPCLSNL